MKERTWLTCADPKSMLRFVRDKVSNRKLRLFACGFCRYIGDRLFESESREAVEVGENYADGHASTQELQRANRAAEQAIRAAFQRAGEMFDRTPRDELRSGLEVEKYAPEYADDIVNDMRPYFQRAAARHATWAACCAHPQGGWAAAWLLCQDDDDDTSTDEEPNLQVDILRDITGNPYRPVSLGSSWLAWKEGTVRKLAQGIYDEWAFERLPVLADALEDAGCDNADVLAHCRDGGVHVRGCWVVDLLLGKS